MARIRKVAAREILDSRGFPTIEVDVELSDGALGRAVVPSGASTGSHEALELRDGGGRYLGKGVLKAVKNVRELAAAVRGKSSDDLPAIDEAMIRLDGTPNKSRLGANALLGVSMAVCRAGAVSRKAALYSHIRSLYSLENKRFVLPAPMLNIVNGGKHADSGIDVQEFMIVPVGAKSFSGALRAASEIYHHLKKILAAEGHVVSIGDEGGFAPKIRTHDRVLKTILRAIKAAGYRPGADMAVALDSAASEFFFEGAYKFEGRKLSSEQLASVYEKWASKYPVISFEDPLAEDDWEGWRRLTARIGGKARVVGDDLFVTNPLRLARGIETGTANAILIKLNQIGTVSETVGVILQAQQSGYAAIVSHRSGETEDSFIADLALAVNCGAIKTGAPCRSERLAKYNQLLRLEESLGRKAAYAAGRAFKIRR